MGLGRVPLLGNVTFKVIRRVFKLYSFFMALVLGCIYSFLQVGVEKVEKEL